MNNRNTYTPINKGQFTLEPLEREAEFERKRGWGVENEYSENRRQWVEYPEQQYVANYPLHVDIELASVCNLRCPMCYTITPEFKKKVNAKLMECGSWGNVTFAELPLYRLGYLGRFLTVSNLDCIIAI